MSCTDDLIELYTGPVEMYCRNCTILCTGDLVELYMSPVETYCRNLDYYIPDEGRSKELTGEEMVRIREYFLFFVQDLKLILKLQFSYSSI